MAQNGVAPEMIFSNEPRLLFISLLQTNEGVNTTAKGELGIAGVRVGERTRLLQRASCDVRSRNLALSQEQAEKQHMAASALYPSTHYLPSESPSLTHTVVVSCEPSKSCVHLPHTYITDTFAAMCPACSNSGRPSFQPPRKARAFLSVVYTAW